MTKSMTGYGQAQVENGSFIIEAELKTLNSKFLDLSVRLPKEISSFEYKIRELLSKGLVRGKASFSLELTPKDGSQNAIYNQQAFNQFFSELKSLAEGLSISDADVFNNVLKVPEVLQQSEKADGLVEEKYAMDLVADVLSKCNEFRDQEGNSLEKALLECLFSIKKGLEDIKKIEPDRLTNIKSRITGSIEEFIGKDNIDENRYEQELIYYLEKLDISEELVRLATHIDYFEETIKLPESQGKKRGFISQEMGREINTIGSKANDALIQRLVVDMKDDLEKIKEQVLNVL